MRYYCLCGSEMVRCQKVYFLGVHEDELQYKISLRSLIQMCMSMRRNPRPKAKRWPLIFSSRTFQSLLKKGFWARKDPCESFPRFPFDLALNKKQMHQLLMAKSLLDTSMAQHNFESRRLCLNHKCLIPTYIYYNVQLVRSTTQKGAKLISPWKG